MPAARQRSRSSFRDRAVKAMTGKCPPAARSRSRIARTTWKPSSSGMCTSRSSRSKSGSGNRSRAGEIVRRRRRSLSRSGPGLRPFDPSRASASRPLFASRTLWPRRTSSRSRCCAVEFVVLGHQDAAAVSRPDPTDGWTPELAQAGGRLSIRRRPGSSPGRSSRAARPAGPA